MTERSGGSVQMQAQIDANLFISGKLEANSCEFGVNNCKIIIDNNGGIEHLKIVLPSDGKANGTSDGHEPQTYDMRSIIESIQELNRRYVPHKQLFKECFCVCR